MRFRWLVFLAITICLIGGLIAGANARSIQAALTVQSAAGQGKQHGAPPAPAKSPTAPATTPATTPLPGGVSVLAKDTFQRAAQVFWGTASDGNTWGGDANSIEIFSVAHDTGLIAAGQGAFNAILGPASVNVDIVASATVNHFASAGAVNVGVALRWTDTNDFYKALIDGSQLEIISRVKGVSKMLVTVPFAAHGGVSYTLRFSAIGAELLAKAWQTGQPEPQTWLLQTADPALTQGKGGIRVVLQSTTAIQVTSFIETTVASDIT